MPGHPLQEEQADLQNASVTTSEMKAPAPAPAPATHLPISMLQAIGKKFGGVPPAEIAQDKLLKMKAINEDVD
jgi:hypothetical protein